MSALSLETYVTRNLQKISGKRWELYVITRVLHKLDDPDIEFICQQYINPPKNKNYYLADLAFPSLKLYLEIDEGQHAGEAHKESDLKRDAEIFEATDWECKRIAVFVSRNGRKQDKKLTALNKEIDRFVEHVREKKQQLIRQGTFVKWDYEQKFLPESYTKRKVIKVSDNVALLSHRDVLRLFGYKKGHYQRAVWKIGDTNKMVWFPKLYANAEWVNTFEKRTGLICQYRKDKEPYPIPRSDARDRVVFAHQKNIFGQTVYKFFGVFEPDFSRTSPVFHYFKRTATSIDLSNYA